MNQDYQIIQEWHELFKDGLISQEEFEAKKKEILGISSIENEAKPSNIKNKPADSEIKNGIQNISKRKKNINANQIFFIVLALIVASLTVFWFLSNKNITAPNGQSATINKHDTLVSKDNSVQKDSASIIVSDSAQSRVEENMPYYSPEIADSTAVVMDSEPKVVYPKDAINALVKSFPGLSVSFEGNEVTLTGTATPTDARRIKYAFDNLRIGKINYNIKVVDSYEYQSYDGE